MCVRVRDQNFVLNKYQVSLVTSAYSELWRLPMLSCSTYLLSSVSCEFSLFLIKFWDFSFITNPVVSKGSKAGSGERMLNVDDMSLDSQIFSWNRYYLPYATCKIKVKQKWRIQLQNTLGQKYYPAIVLFVCFSLYTAILSSNPMSNTFCIYVALNEILIHILWKKAIYFIQFCCWMFSLILLRHKILRLFVLGNNIADVFRLWLPPFLTLVFMLSLFHIPLSLAFFFIISTLCHVDMTVNEAQFPLRLSKDLKR